MFTAERELSEATAIIGVLLPDKGHRKAHKRSLRSEGIWRQMVGGMRSHTRRTGTPPCLYFRGLKITDIYQYPKQQLSLLYVCGCFACTYVSAGTSRGQKGASDTPGTELQAVVSYYMDVGNQIRVLFKSGKCY